MTDHPGCPKYSRAERDLIDAAFPDRTAGRWCVHCQQHGSHHSERHDDFAAGARRAASLPSLPLHVAARAFEALDPIRLHTTEATSVVPYWIRADPGVAMPVEVPAGFVRLGFDKPEPPPPPATPADLDRAAWDRLHREADRLRPKAPPRSDGLPPLAVHPEEVTEAEDFLISAGTMQDVEITCLRKGCTWRIDVERETGHAFPLLSGVLARIERHLRDDHAGRVCDTCDGEGEVVTMVPGFTGEPVEGTVECPDCDHGTGR